MDLTHFGRQRKLSHLQFRKQQALKRVFFLHNSTVGLLKMVLYSWVLKKQREVLQRNLLLSRNPRHQSNQNQKGKNKSLNSFQQTQSCKKI